MHISIVLIFSILSTAYCQQCGLSTAGVIVQQITLPQASSQGLFWHEEGKLIFVDKLNPAICVVDEKTVTFSRTNITGITNIVHLMSIKNNDDKLIGFTDKKLISIDFNLNEQNKNKIVEAKELFVIENDEKFHLTKGLADKNGILWIDSSMNVDKNEEANGKVYKVNAGTQIVEEILNENISPNGLGFSANNKIFYQVDKHANCIYKFDFNLRKGEIKNPNIIFNVSQIVQLEGRIGDIVVNDDNTLWIAMFGSGHIVLFDWEENKILQQFKIPSKYPISMTMGGKNGNILFIGTLGTFNTFSSSADGAVFAITGHGKMGLPAYEVDMSQ